MRKRRHKRPHPSKRAPPALFKDSLGRRILRWKWPAIAVGALTTIMTWYPWLSIQRSGMVDPRNPYSEMFEISNGGYIPLTNLDSHCIANFDTPGVHLRNSGMWAIGFANYLGHGGTVTLPCFRLFHISEMPSGAKLDIEVIYAFYHLNPQWLRRSQVFHFQSIRGDDGSQHWQFIS
jgi:hypothetical protein